MSPDTLHAESIESSGHPLGFRIAAGTKRPDVLGTGAARDVHVLADLDRSLRAQDHEPPVAPGGEPVGREPVDPDIAASAVAFEDGFAEVLELGVLRMSQVRDR